MILFQRKEEDSKINNDYARLKYRGKISFESIKDFLNPFALKRKIVHPEDQEFVDDGKDPIINSVSSNKFNETVLKFYDVVIVHVHKDVHHPALQDVIEKFK